MLLKVASSLDGFIDDRSSERRVFSSPEDRVEVERLRAEADAILIGAETLRKDNPRLILENQDLIAERIAEGRNSQPAKVLLTKSGNVESGSLFFTLGDNAKCVFCPRTKLDSLRATLPETVDLIPFEGDLTPELILTKLYRLGVRRLLLEGGESVIRQFAASGHIDRIRFALAPEMLSASGGPRLPGQFQDRGYQIESVEALGGTLVIYACAR